MLHVFRHRRRGQAIFETVIFLPMFLLVLFGVLWAAQVAVQYERGQNAVRYSSLVSQHNSPYLDFSLAALYSQLGSTTLPDVSCAASGTTPLTTPLSDAAPTYVATATNTTASPPFFSPATGTPPVGTCGFAGYWGVKGATWILGDTIFNTQERSISSSLNIPYVLANVLGTSSVSTSQFFYKQVGVNVLLACYPDFNALVTSNLKPNFATTTSPPAQILYSGSCTALTNCQQFQNTDEVPGYYAPSPSCNLQDP